MNNNGVLIKPLGHYVAGEKSISRGSTAFLSTTEFRDKSAKQRYIRNLHSQITSVNMDVNLIRALRMLTLCPRSGIQIMNSISHFQAWF